MTDHDYQARLLIFALRVAPVWRENGRWLAGFFEALHRAGIGRAEFTIEPPESMKSSRPVAADAAQARFLEGKKGGYIFRSTSPESAVIELYDYGPFVSVQIDCRLGPVNPPSLDSLVALARDIDSSMTEMGTVGPSFRLELPSVNYPRPRPPRQSPRWGQGVAAYFVSCRFDQSGAESAEAGTFDRLLQAELPSELKREVVGDLMIIQSVFDFDDEERVTRGLSIMERWIGDTLQLPFDETFKANGDQMWRVVESERVKPFSFYDETSRIAYKVVAEDSDQELDSETIAELRRILPMTSLPDGRPISSTIMIFAFRDGATSNFEMVTGLGASGVLYMDEEGFWNPEPPGDWMADDPAGQA